MPSGKGKKASKPPGVRKMPPSKLISAPIHSGRAGSTRVVSNQPITGISGDRVPYKG